MKNRREESSSITGPQSCATVLDLWNPRSSDIDIGHIAHHLALLNQFGGFTMRSYSFAEHALLATEIAERELGLHDLAGLTACLLRDAHAAYIGDSRTPAACFGGEDLRCLQQRVQTAVHRRFALQAAAAGYAPLIRESYLQAQATVLRDVAVERLRAMADGTPAAGWLNLQDRGGLTWHDWRQAFFDRFGELRFARDLLAAGIGDRSMADSPLNAPAAVRTASGP